MKKNNFIPNMNLEWFNTMLNTYSSTTCSEVCLIILINYIYKLTQSPDIKLTKNLQKMFGLNHRSIKPLLIKLNYKGYIILHERKIGKPFEITLQLLPPTHST